MQKEILERFNKLNIELTKQQIEQFEIYYKFLIEYNNIVNLTAIINETDVYIKHFLDSVLPFNELPLNATVCDIGTGAGFPAVPLKIVRPDIKLLLIDSLAKRTKFLSLLIEKLKLEDVEIIHSRAEEVGCNEKFREKYDVCVCRGVAKLNTLCEYCVPMLKINGKMLAYKSVEIEEEINNSLKAVSEMGGEIEKIIETQIPNTDINRKIIVIKKVKQTPQKYPRGLNKPKLTPIE